MPPSRTIACALTIAGSDSSGGAGIATDLKTFAASGVHGLAAITAVTAQTERGVRAIQRIPAAHVRAQIEAAFEDFPIGAIKIGMLGAAPIVRAVVQALRAAPDCPIVLDPVLASSSGAALLSTAGVRVLRDELVPLATLLTPNLPEAQILLGRKIRDPAQAAQHLRALGANAVLLKGGHARGREVCDVLADARGVMEFRHPRLPIHARGTGCALASAIAAGLARGRTMRTAITNAEAFLQRALAQNHRANAGTMRYLDLGQRTSG
ncbi:MAG: bifunctional hydroxymethylpyrimidine kinase/phosphomethylpyrimidine kinase [Proteobacteria bacterium]|nr:bifunctional hydroxymethylpyrimidine kinase/phosphomethylpyrimidine kinase [Pseudomonadota bacterium]